MDVKIIGEHVEITESINEYIKNKFSHLPIPDKMNVAEFRIGKEGHLKHHIKFSANFNHKHVNLEVIEENAYIGIDKLMKKLHTMLTKNKDSNHSTHLRKQ